VAALQKVLPTGGGSNNWAIAGGRTLSGKPLLANDPHLAPMVPAPWYLAHVRTPDWSVAGATMVGGPAVPVGHNGFACWGLTAALTDTADLFVEALGPDGASVREADGSFTPCQVVREVIRVKGHPDVTEDVLVTPRGPVVSPLLDGVPVAISLAAVWLGPHPVRGLLDAPRAKDFDTFRRAFADWPVLPQNVAYADAGGTIGWQLVGQLPVRKGGHGLLPRPADVPDAGWAAGLLPFDRLPFVANPAEGFVATANGKPGDDPALGADFLDEYRAAVIREELAKHPVGWTVADCQKLQLNIRSKPWEELRDVVLGLAPTDPDGQQALDLLRDWDGQVAADSPAAAVFELVVAEVSVRVAKAKAPTAFVDALGGTRNGPLSRSMFGVRRVAHLVRLLQDQPPGWFPRPWADELADALSAVVRRLRADHGPSPAWWQWGDLRLFAFDHVLLGGHRWLGPAFNLPRVPAGGDANTVCQAACRPLDPTAAPHQVAGLRAVFDTADWANCRFAVAGGQSGNPLSGHYADLFDLWVRGEGIPIPTAPDDVLRQAVATLRLLPG
jgi:penicillin amidase